MSNSPTRRKGIIIAAVLVVVILIIAYLTLKPTQTTPNTRSITLFSWSDYTDPDIISDFERIYNVKVEINYYESNEEMIAKLQTGGLGTYDVIVPSTYFIPALKSLNLIETLDQTRLPNLKNVSTAFRDIEVDPGYHLSVPYQWGTSCMAVRTGDISAVEPSWKIFFDKDSNIGNFVLFDTAREAMGAALKYLGYSLNSTNIDEIRVATELLIQAKSFPNFMGFDSGVSGLNKVMGGVAAAAQVYSGESIKASKEDPELHYIVPNEGCEIWLDLLAVPRNAPNIDVAYEFLNFIMEPEIGARVATYNNYATPYEASLPFIPQEDLNNPSMYPSEEQLKKLEYTKDLGENTKLYNEAWNFVKTR